MSHRNLPFRLHQQPFREVACRCEILQLRGQSPPIDVFVIQPRIADREDRALTVLCYGDDVIAVRRHDSLGFARERQRRNFFHKDLLRRREYRISGGNIDAAHLIICRWDDLEFAVFVELDAERLGKRVELIKLGILPVVAHQYQYAAAFDPIVDRLDVARFDKIRVRGLLCRVRIDDDVNARLGEFARGRLASHLSDVCSHRTELASPKN